MRFTFCVLVAVIACAPIAAFSEPYGYDDPTWKGYWTPLGQFDGAASRIGGSGRSTAYFHGSTHLQKFAGGIAALDYPEEQRDIDNGLYWQLQMTFGVRCGENTFTLEELRFYDKQGHQLFKRTGQSGSEAEVRDVKQGTLSEALYKAACALPDGMS